MKHPRKVPLCHSFSVFGATVQRPHRLGPLPGEGQGGRRRMQDRPCRRLRDRPEREEAEVRGGPETRGIANSKFLNYLLRREGAEDQMAELGPSNVLS